MCLKNGDVTKQGSQTHMTLIDLNTIPQNFLLLAVSYQPNLKETRRTRLCNWEKEG